MNIINLNEKTNSIVKSLKEEVTNKTPIPAGYTEIRLSTEGLVGAPKVFHIRNFKTGDILALSLTVDNDLASRVIQILNEMIYEEDVDVSNFHEKEVEELLVRVYTSFTSKTISSIPYTLTDSDWNYVKQNQPEVYEDIKNKKYTPTLSFNIEDAVETYDLPKNFNSNITIKNKVTGFYVTFSFIKYGDQITIKKWLDKYFEEKENLFRIHKSKIERNNKLMSQFEQTGDQQLLEKLLPINSEEDSNYKQYLSEKLQTLTEVLRVSSIVNYNGEDVSNLSIDEKYERFSKDAQIDYGMISKLDKKQRNIHFGLNPLIKVKNPITKEDSKMQFSFRLSTILQAIQLSGDAQYDDSIDDTMSSTME